MAKPRTILVPLDSSETSPKVISWIQDHLIREGDKVVLLSCYESAAKNVPIVMGGDFESACDKLNKEYSSACHRLLETCAETLNKDPVTIVQVVECGDARIKIDEQITKSQVDMVVMGRRKRSALKTLVHSLGSVTSHVSHSSPVPVLIVP